MLYDPLKHHRRSIRLKGYDYAQEGAYFITICTFHRECLLGDVKDGSVILNDFGETILHDWLHLPDFHPALELDTFIVMPNHLHGILTIEHPNPAGATLGEIVRRFKMFSTKTINKERDSVGAALWQRDLYERIIRNEPMLAAIREYIENNPANWSEDVENPAVPRRN